MRKYSKKVLAYTLAGALMMPSVSVSATAKPTLSASEKVIAVGSTSILTVKNKQAKATYSFTSSDKKVATVNKKGIVTGKKLVQ